MNDNSGFIVLNRKILDWEWYQDTKTLRLFIHCLLKANWKDSKFKGIDVPRGSFVTSLSILSRELSPKKSVANKENFTVQNVRTALNHLILTKEITSTNYYNFRVITVNNYEEYQNYNKDDNKGLTSLQQASNKVSNNNRTIYKQLNNSNNNNISTTTNNNTGTNEPINQNLFELIESNFGRTLNTIEIEELSKWEDNELTRYVIKKSVLSNIYSIRYISKVLHTYKQKGIKTVVDAEKEYERFEKERNSKTNKSTYNSKEKSGMQKFKDTLDEWERKMEEVEKNVS